MKLESLTRYHLRDLTSHEIKMGIKIGACLARRRRHKDVERNDRAAVITFFSMCFPPNDNGKPNEELIDHYVRIKRKLSLMEDWSIYRVMAARRMAYLGNLSPSPDEIEAIALEFAREDKGVRKVIDRMKASDEIRETRLVWFPAKRIPVKLQRPAP